MASESLFNFNIGSLLKKIFNNFTRSFESLFYGYDMYDYEISNDSGKPTEVLKCKPKGASEDVTLETRISAINVGEVFKREYNVIKKLTAGKIKKNKETRDVIKELTGADLSESVGTGDYIYQKQLKNNEMHVFNDISLKAAMDNKTGLLGIDLETCTSDTAETWFDIAFDKLRYELICSTNRETDDIGKVSNQDLLKCVDWIHKYIDHIGNAGDDRQLSHEEKVSQENNVNLHNSDEEESIEDAFNLIRPILLDIQAELRKAYQKQLNSELSLDKLIPQDEDNQEDAQNKETSEENANPENNSEETKDMNEQSTSASAHINITLRKIQASDDIDVLLLEANCPPSDTLTYVDDIINQDEFFDTLTDEPQSYSIDVTDEGYDIEQCDEQLKCDSCKILEEVFFAAIQAYRNLQIVHWMSSGPDMMKIHTMSEEMYDELSEEIDTLGELLVEKCGTIPQLDFPCEYIDIKKYDLQSGLDAIKIVISPYIDVIDYAYPNQTSDVQSTLDEWLRYWNKQLNYVVKGQEI